MFSDRTFLSPGRRAKSPVGKNDSHRASNIPQKQEQMQPAARPPPAKGEEELDPEEVLLGRISDDLTGKIRAWAHQVEERFTDTESTPSTVTVKIIAATGLEHLGEPFWLAAASGSVAETGSPEPLAEAMAPHNHPPAGTPSWADEPLSLRIHDLTTDVLLFLCEADMTSATRACVGRVALPLTALLPQHPCAGRTPPTRRMWVNIYPPAPEYAAGYVHASYAPAVSDVTGSGMHKPMMHVGALERPQARALLEVSLELEGSLLGHYASAPPFDVHAEHPGSARHERAPLAPERIELLEQRVRAVCSSLLAPACVRLTRTRPWSAGLVLLGMAYLLFFYITLPLLPSWLLLLYVLNASALRLLGLSTLDAYELPAARRASNDPAHARVYTTPGGLLPPAAERLRTLEDVLLPIVREVESYCSDIERLASAPLSADLRASFLVTLPLLLGLFVATMMATIASGAVVLAGGASAAAFDACVIAFVLHLVSFHHAELRDCVGEPVNGADARLMQAARDDPYGPAARRLGGRAVVLDEDGQEPPLLDSARRQYLTSVWANVWRRIPDLPTQLHRAMAESSMVEIDEAGGKGCLASIGIG